MQKSFKTIMSGNKYKKKKSSRGPANNAAESTGKVVTGVLDGSLITKHTTAGVVPYIVFLSGLALFLIFNTYYAEKQARELDRLRREVTELRIQYVETKSTYMYLTNRSELAQRLSSQGFIEPVEPPEIILDNLKRQRIWHRLIKINP